MNMFTNLIFQIDKLLSIYDFDRYLRLTCFSRSKLVVLLIFRLVQNKIFEMIMTGVEFYRRQHPNLVNLICAYRAGYMPEVGVGL